MIQALVFVAIGFIIGFVFGGLHGLRLGAEWITKITLSAIENEPFELKMHVADILTNAFSDREQAAQWIMRDWRGARKKGGAT